MRHSEKHRIARIGWLRAAVLGANDGILSTTSLIIGVAAAGTARSGVLVAGLAALIAGSMSMAAGEYVSVSSQADAEEADLDRERWELEHQDHSERLELANIYVGRGLDPALAAEVADKLMEHDALGAHARDELGIWEMQRAKPITAALASAAAFASGSAMPLLVAFVSSKRLFTPMVAGTSLVFLAVLGSLAARAGGAPILQGALRVTLWGAFAMAVTGGLGALIGSVV